MSGTPFIRDSVIIYYYRYISLSLISLVYLLSEPSSNLVYKIGVIVTLAASVPVITDIYRKSEYATQTLKISIALETLCIFILLCPTGGIESPFFWYATNPILVAAIFLSPLFCWSVLLSYMVGVTGFSYLVMLNREVPISEFIMNHMNNYLVLILMTLAIQALAEMRNGLERANKQTNESMEHLMSLYQVVEQVNYHQTSNTAKIITEYAIKLTKAKSAFFWLQNVENDVSPLTLSGEDDHAQGALLTAITGELDRSVNTLTPEVNVVHVQGIGSFHLISVRSSTQLYGLLGVRLDDMDTVDSTYWCNRQLTFLSEISTAIFEREQLDKLSQQLLITEEKNRIAGEMHDSVSQQLFGIVYAIHTINRKRLQLSEAQLQNQLDVIQESADVASKELRSTIYNLSTKKNASPAWLGTVQSHLQKLSQLYGVEISLTMDFAEEIMSVHQQLAVYRIISEAVGNAIRHGQADNIDIQLRLEKPDTIQLTIIDNGNGFNPHESKLEQRQRGLGIDNMQSQMISLQGSMELTSQQGEGTRVDAHFPRAI